MKATLRKKQSTGWKGNPVAIFDYYGDRAIAYAMSTDGFTRTRELMRGSILAKNTMAKTLRHDGWTVV